MSNATLRVPSYRHHKPSGRAVVTVDSRDIYLGPYNSAGSRREYKRVIAEWSAQGGTLPTAQTAELTVTELVAAFMRHGGRVFTSLVLLIGIGIIAIPTGLFASALTRTRKRADELDHISVEIDG